MKHAILRCDASPEIGAGHAARCLALADALSDSGFEILFATNREAPDTFPAIRRHRVEFAPSGRTHEPEWLAGLAEGANASVVLDLRDLDRKYESDCRSRGLKLAILNDFPERPHDCDVLIDQTIGRDASEYAAFVPAHCKVLTGTQYALVAKSFRSLRDEAEKRRRQAPANRLLLGFGATDPFNYLGRLLPALVESASGMQIEIAAGSRPLDDVRTLCEKHADRISVIRDAAEMPRALLAAGLAAGLAGSSAWERCTLGLPTAMFLPSDYYRPITARLVAAGAAECIGERNFDPEETSGKILALLRDGNRLAAMSGQAFAVCDGQGASRVVEALDA